MLNKCLSIQTDDRKQMNENTDDRKNSHGLRMVYYNFEFIEDHQKGEVHNCACFKVTEDIEEIKVIEDHQKAGTRRRGGNEATEGVLLTDLTPPVKEEENKGERRGEEEVVGGEGRVQKKTRREAEMEIIEEQAEGIGKEDVAVQKKELKEECNEDNSEVEEDVDYMWKSYCPNAKPTSDDGTSFPSMCGSNDNRCSNHPLALMVSYIITLILIRTVYFYICTAIYVSMLYLKLSYTKNLF